MQPFAQGHESGSSSEIAGHSAVGAAVAAHLAGGQHGGAGLSKPACTGPTQPGAVAGSRRRSSNTAGHRQLPR